MIEGVDLHARIRGTPTRRAVLTTALLLGTPRCVFAATDPGFHATADFVPPAERAPVPFEIVGGALLFRALVAGRETWALLDNGAPSAVDKSFAQTAQLRPISEQPPLRTPSGWIKRKRIESVAVVIPGQVNLVGPLNVVDLGPISLNLERKIEFVLGRDYLTHLALVVGWLRNSLEFLRGGTLAIPAPALAVPILGDDYLVAARIGGRELRLAIDLGSNVPVTLTPSAWAKVNVPSHMVVDTTNLHADGLNVRTKSSVIDSMMLGSKEFGPTAVTIEPQTANSADGTIGLALLTKCDFGLDADAAKLWIAPRGALNLL